MLAKILRNLPCLLSGLMDQNGEYAYIVLGNTTLQAIVFLSHLKRQKEKE